MCFHRNPVAGTNQRSGKTWTTETRRWFDFMDENQLSWCTWSVADLTETSAALRPGVSTEGGWKDEDISDSGKLVREELRAKN